jgi:hypothetical protein
MKKDSHKVAVADVSKPLLNVVEAIKALRNGALVRCLSIEGNPRHDEPDWLCGKPGTNEIWICAVNVDGHFPQHRYSLSVSDVLSTEWVKHAEKSKAWE